MAPFPRSLAGSVDRVKLADQLKLPLTLRSFPSTSRCPLCSQPKLELHWDDAHDAEWVYCANCHFAGDLLELYAKSRGGNVEAAYEELIRDGSLPSATLDDVQRHCGTHIRVRRDVDELWRRASQRLADREIADVLSPLGRLGLRERDLHPCSFTAIARWIGVASRQELEDVWHPGSYGNRGAGTETGEARRSRGTGPGATRLFRGRDWGWVLIVRSMDLPGRTCGFLIIGRDGKEENGDIFFREIPGLPRNSGRVESGLMMREQLKCVVWGPKKRINKKRINIKWGGMKFVCPDPVEALSMQLETIQDGFSPALPLLAISDGPGVAATSCWSGVDTNSCVFFDRSDPPRAIRAALRAGGQVGTAISNEQSLFRGANVLDHAYRTRTPAVEALAQHLEKLSPSEAASLFQTMELSPAQEADLSRRLSPELQAALDRSSTERTLVYGRHRIRETTAGWEDLKTGGRLVNGVVRITRLTTLQTGGRLVAGSVSIEGSVWDFQSSADEIEATGLFAIVRAFLRKQRGPELVFDSKWTQRAWPLVLELSTPVRDDACHRVGWNEESQRIVLPQGTVGPRGYEPTVVAPGAQRELPLHNWIPGGNVSSVAAKLDELSVAEETVFWALGALVVEALLRRCRGLPERGTLVVGTVAQEFVLGLGPVMGLLSPAYPVRRSSDDQLEWLSAQVDRDDVPPILDLRDGRGQTGVARWLESLGNHRALILVPEISGLSAQTQRRFHVLTLPEAWRAARDWRPPRSVPTELLVEWLQSLAHRGFRPANRRPVPLEQVIQDLAGWSVDHKLDGEKMGKVAKVLTAADRVAPINALNRLVKTRFGEPRSDQSWTSSDRQDELDLWLQGCKAPRVDWIGVASNEKIAPLAVEDPSVVTAH